MRQTLSDILFHFTWLDGAGLALFVVGAWVLTWAIEHGLQGARSTHLLMRAHRQGWMRAMSTRDVRIFDAQVLATLRQGASFFASATLIAIGGGVALLGQVDRVQAVAGDLSALPIAPPVVWEVKLIFVLLVLVSAFLKFAWSIRIFGYCAVLVAATPNAPQDPMTQSYGRKAAELNYLADRSFTRGLRGIYLALAAFAWLAGAGAFIAATLVTFVIVLRREFASRSRAVLLEEDFGNRSKPHGRASAPSEGQGPGAQGW